MYHYTECGLDNVFLINGYKVVESKGKSVCIVYDTKGLHRAIAMDILSGAAVSGAEIEFLREEMGLAGVDNAQIMDEMGQKVLEEGNQIKREFKEMEGFWDDVRRAPINTTAVEAHKLAMP